MLASKRAADDYNNMINMRDELISKIDNISIEMTTSASSSYYRGMIQPAQAINDICTEIVSCLNEHHLKMFTDMICNGVDIAAFLIQEGSVLMDSEKEKSAVSRIRRMIEGVEGEWVDKECAFRNCVYLKTHKMLETYFKSYQSTTSSQFTQYDLEQIEHAHKNVLTIKRLLNTEISIELKDVFNLNNIMNNIQLKRVGIDVSYIKYLMEEAAKSEQRNQFISQLSDIERTIENMKKLLIPTDNTDDAINKINEEISNLRSKDMLLDKEINECSIALDTNDRNRLLLSQVKHINIDELNGRHAKLSILLQQLSDAENEYNNLYSSYSELSMTMNSLTSELKIISDAYNQYVNTVAEIDKHDAMNGKYKIIAEATSSTKGKPVIAIRDTVDNALALTNRLLNIMYDGEIELLEPTIDENNFTLPFRCGSHLSPDIRYGSQSESTLLSLALEMALSSSLTQYNVCLVDEIDAALDIDMCSLYVAMLYELCSTLKIEQMFLISHHIDEDSSAFVHRLDLMEIINKES
jgi:DNA repair exonuclease SbcCD ATPase subunit